MIAKELRTKRAKLVEDANVIAQNAAATAEDRVNAARMLDEADGILAQIDLVERAGTAHATLGVEAAHVAATPGRPSMPFNAAREFEVLAAIRDGGPNALASLDQASRDYWVNSTAREKRIVRAMLCGPAAMRQLSDEDQAHFRSACGELSPEFQTQIRAAGGIVPDTSGGYTVAPLFQTDLLIAMKLQGGMRSVARVIQTATGAVLPWPTMDDTAQVATIVGAEHTDVGSGTDLSFGRNSIGAHTYTSGVMKVSRQLLQDSAFSFDTVIRDAMGGRFVRGQNAHFTTGTGVNQPNGVITAAALGQTGASGQTSTVIYNDLMELIYSVDPVYRPGASFMMHDSTVKVLRELKDSYGRPLWTDNAQSALVGNQPATLLNYPVVINQNMATAAASAKSILFGNFNSYIIRDTLGMQIMVLNERYAELLQVGYLAFMRSDGNLITAASPIKYYAHPAS